MKRSKFSTTPSGLRSYLVKRKMLPNAVPKIPHTLSSAAPTKAAQIRSAVTGALIRESLGLLCFEHTVETTFLLPWDLNPKVVPEKLGVGVRDGIRGQLLDEAMLHYLEGHTAINWQTTVVWQARPLPGSPQAMAAGGPWHQGGAGEGDWVNLDHIAPQLEQGYHSGPTQVAFSSGFNTFQVDYAHKQLVNQHTGGLFELRRLAFAPLMPLKTEDDNFSLYHAASLGFWGVHDRTSLLSQAVSFTLNDFKAQFLLYDRWSQHSTQHPTSPQPVKTEFPHWEEAKKSFAKAPQLHIFTLANIVQRPIIIYSHQDCPIGGIYLPLLWEDSGGEFPCHAHSHLRNPLVLGYNASTHHFTPLVTFKGVRGPDPILYPLTSSSGKLLPIPFLSQSQQLLEPTQILTKLLFIDLIPPTVPPPSPSHPATPTDHTHQTLAVVSTAATMPEVMETLVKRYQSLFL